MLKYDSSIFFSIATKTDLNERYDIIKNIISEVCNMFIEKFNQKLQLVYFDINGHKRNRYSEKNLQKLFLKMSNQDVGSICITEWNDNYYGPTSEQEYNTAAVALCVTLGDPTRWRRQGDSCDGITVSVSHRLLNQFSRTEMQDFFVELFKAYFIQIEGVNGFISNETHSEALGMTYSHIDKVYYRTPSDASEHFNENTRGYFWGNMLTGKHIERLGGIEAIKKKAPCFLIESVSEESVYLQLTDNVFDYSDESLKKLREYLLPLFPPKTEKMYPRKKEDLQGLRERGIVIRTFDEDLI